MPYFRNVSERDSYLKHLYNYQEQKEDEQYWMMRDLQQGPVGTILEKDGWETVVRNPRRAATQLRFGV